MTTKPTNTQIAGILERIAELLEFQDTNPFRVNAYRAGGQMIRSLDKPVADFVTDNKMDDLKALPGIGDGLAGVIGEVVSSGKSNLLENLTPPLQSR
jgi:DNA polymerase (family X)